MLFNRAATLVALLAAAAAAFLHLRASAPVDNIYRGVATVACGERDCALDALAEPSLLRWHNDAARRAAIEVAWRVPDIERSLSGSNLSFSTKWCLPASCSDGALFLNVNADIAAEANVSVRLHDRTILPFGEFWASASARDGTWRYAGLTLDRERDVELTRAADVAAPRATLSGRSRRAWAARLWFSSAGVEAQLHYDELHNAFVQLVGRKEIVLLPPNASTWLRLYPRPHPLQRQSRFRVPLHRSARAPAVPVCTCASEEGYALVVADAERGCGADALGWIDTAPEAAAAFSRAARRVVLHPGDTLYIPPYWYHAVLALDASLSLSLTASAEEAPVVHAVRAQRHCTDAWWPQAKKALALRLHLVSLLGRPRLADLFAQRYASSGAAPSAAAGAGGDAAWAQSCDDAARGDAAPLLTPAERARAIAVARTRRALFDTIRNGAAREQIEMNEAEMMIAQELGHGTVAAFLRRCVLDGDGA